MKITCKCGYSEEFRKSEDILNYRQAGWVVYGFDIVNNGYNMICKICVKSLPENTRKVLGIKD